MIKYQTFTIFLIITLSLQQISFVNSSNSNSETAVITSLNGSNNSSSSSSSLPLSSLSCGPKFPVSCYCGYTFYDDAKRYVVNCTNLGLKNTTILEYIPEETEVIIFTGNIIEELPWNVFGAINDYDNLQIIDMSNNHINEIRGKTYHHVQNVKRLILNHNNLSISRFNNEFNHHHPRVFSNFINLEELHLTDAFLDNTSAELSNDLHDIFINSNLTKLKKLHLEQNEIINFNDPNIFCDLPSLNDLHLGDNFLKEINFNIECLKNLRFLDLQRNKFENLKIYDLKLLNKLQLDEEHKINNEHLVVDFSLNPFICDCKINPLHVWIKVTSVIVRNIDNLMCYHNGTYTELIKNIHINKCTKEQIKDLFNNKNIDNDFNTDLLKNNDNDYIINNNNNDARTITLSFLLTVLCFVLFGLVITLIYLSRDKIIYLITPVIDTVTKRVQYTTVKDEDIPEVHV